MSSITNPAGSTCGQDTGPDAGFMLSCYQQLRPQVFPRQQRPQLPFGNWAVSVHLGNSRLVVGLIDILEEFKDIASRGENQCALLI
jgi:hypothetical protein